VIILQALEASGWSLLQKPVRLPLDKYPLLVIRGKNLNSGDPRQSNAAGKSLLMSVLPTIRYSAPPVATKARDLAGMVNGSMLALDFKTDVPYRIEQSFTKSVHYKIHRNGKDSKVRTTPLARKRIEELLPWTPEVFYSTIYLDGRRPFRFQMGTDSERLAFFTQLFQLDEYNYLHKRLLARRLALKEDAVRASTLEAELVRQTRARKESGWSKAKAAKWKTISEEARTLQASWAEANRKAQAVAPLVALWEKQQELDKLLAKPPKVGEDTVKEQVRLFREWAEYETVLEQYESTRKRLLKQLSKLPEHRSAEDIERDLSSVNKLLGRMEATIESLTDQVNAIDERLSEMRSEYREAESQVQGLPKPKEALTTEEIEAERHRLNGLRKLADLAEDGHKLCPTCGAKLNTKNVRRLVSEASKRMKVVQQGVKYLEAVERLASLEKEGKKLKAKLSAPELLQLRTVVNKAKDLSKQQAALTSMLDEARTRAEAQARIDKLKKPKAPNRPKPKTTLEKLRKQYAICMRWSDAKKSWKAVSVQIEELTGKPRIKKAPDVAKWTSLQKQIQVKLNSANSKLSSLQSSRERYRAAKETIQRLNVELEKVKDALTDLPILDALIVAYGNKGLKVGRAAHLASFIEQGLNSKARLIFVEPTTFQCSVTEGKFSVTYTRGKRTADVQRLSGAESKAFALLLLASYLPLVPSHLRTNVLVLDEMDANMSPATKQIFIHDFLPYLQSLVPNIVVVTPDTDTHYPHAKTLTVIKKGEDSTVEGL